MFDAEMKKKGEMKGGTADVYRPVEGFIISNDIDLVSIFLSRQMTWGEVRVCGM